MPGISIQIWTVNYFSFKLLWPHPISNRSIKTEFFIDITILQCENESTTTSALFSSQSSSTVEIPFVSSSFKKSIQTSKLHGMGTKYYIYKKIFNNLFFLFNQTYLHVKNNRNRQDVVQKNFLSLLAILPLKLTGIKSVRTFAGPSIVLKDSLIQPICKKIVIFKLKSATKEEKNTVKQLSSYSFLFEILKTSATQVLFGGILI